MHSQVEAAMDYDHVSITLDTFINKLGNCFNVSQLRKMPQIKALKMLAVNHLESKNSAYPNVYYFEDVDGDNYILNYYKSTGDHDLFIVKPLAYKNLYSSTIDELVEQGKLNGATRYVLEQGFLWDVEDNYYTVLEKYDLSDFIPRARLGSENVAIWVHYNFEPGFFSDKKGHFMYMGKDIAIFSSYKDAKDRCDGLLYGKYPLSAGELARPTYIITNPIQD